MSEDGSVAKLLEERPDLEAPLDAVLAVDSREDTWTYDDLSIDSGPFGELVSRDVVESVGEEYRLADPDAVRRALAGESTVATTGGTERSLALTLPGLPSVDRTTAALVAGAIAVVALVRLHVFGAVYRKGDVVLSGNDPYYYRYWVERVAGEAGGALDVGALSALSSGVQRGEPLTISTLWWVAELLGGSVGAIGHVLAWYPVVSAVLTAGLVYLLAVRLTGDRRIALASVLLLALLPGHAMRTSLGFADHHAFDYVWLAATALLLVGLVDVNRERLGQPRTWLGSLGLGVAVAAQVLSWDAGPLLIVPVGIAVVATALITVAGDRSPLLAGAPVVAGIAVAAVLTASVHVVVGWHTALVAYSPLALLAGTLATLLAAEVVDRTTGDPRHLLAAGVGTVLVALLFALVVAPDVGRFASGQLGRLFGEIPAAEAIGMFDPGTWGVLLLFGFTLVLAVPAMVWATSRAAGGDAPDRTRWAVAATYGWYFFVLSAIQVRFVGEFAAFAAVFAGIGFVWLAAWIEAIPRPDLGTRSLESVRVPDRATVGTLALVFLLVASLGIVQVPVKTSQVTIEDDTYDTATFIEQRAAELGQPYPDNYVLSDWGRNRVYNYFVNGESNTYAYAQRHFADFATSSTPDDWYGQFDGRVQYVVMATAEEEGSRETALSTLTRHLGSASETGDGVAHFQPVYRAESDQLTVFAVVPGAEITGVAPSNATVTASTDVEIPADSTVTYDRRTAANETGQFSLHVANPGTYELEGASTNATVTVSAEAVRSGETVTVDSAS